MALMVVDRRYTHGIKLQGCAGTDSLVASANSSKVQRLSLVVSQHL